MKRQIKNKKVQFVFIIPKELKDRFRTFCHANEVRMGAKLIELIEGVVGKGKDH